MDIVSHGLWGGVAFGRKNKRAYWTAFCFGVAPDLFSFGIFFIERLITGGLSLQSGRPELAPIPPYVHILYDITHSLVIFLIVFLVVYLIRGRFLWTMCAWAIHIGLDIFTHSSEFFPTPFLWPLSDAHFDGVSWGHPYIFFPNLILLGVVYSLFLWSRRKRTLQE